MEQWLASQADRAVRFERLVCVAVGREVMRSRPFPGKEAETRCGGWMTVPQVEITGLI